MPKIQKNPMGDTVEVWAVEGRRDLDPVTALRTYTSLRKNLFGEAKSLPLYLHEDGKIFTKLEFNKDLADLLAVYPELSTERDKWTGHSFRSGLSTILATLGVGVYFEGYPTL